MSLARAATWVPSVALHDFGNDKFGDVLQLQCMDDMRASALGDTVRVHVREDDLEVPEEGNLEVAAQGLLPIVLLGAGAVVGCVHRGVHHGVLHQGHSHGQANLPVLARGNQEVRAFQQVCFADDVVPYSTRIFERGIKCESGVG